MRDLRKQYRFVKVDGELVLDQIVFTEVDYNFYQKAFNHVRKNKILYTQLAMSLGYAMFLAANPSVACAAVISNPCSWIEAMGNGAISAVQMTGVKILTVGMILELVREGMRGGSHNASSILTRYALLIAGVIFAPTFVEILEGFVKSYRP